MRVVGFNFNKMYAERSSSSYEKLSVKTNIDISEIKGVKQDLFKTEEDFIGVKFSFNLEYDPNIAKIELTGDIVFSMDSKTAEEVLKQWKTKNIPEDFRIFLYNFILKKSNVKAFQFEEELNLPLHIPLPSVRKEEPKKKE
ncbi:MAG: hypothetical protein Q7S06_00940 [Nanoarchaeota archaeon]|nr:hypothetical protein [Nanoarchaeota archaeon]